MNSVSNRQLCSRSIVCQARNYNLWMAVGWQGMTRRMCRTTSRQDGAKEWRNARVDRMRSERIGAIMTVPMLKPFSLWVLLIIFP